MTRPQERRLGADLNVGGRRFRLREAHRGDREIPFLERNACHEELDPCERLDVSGRPRVLECGLGLSACDLHMASCERNLRSDPTVVCEGRRCLRRNEGASERQGLLRVSKEPEAQPKLGQVRERVGCARTAREDALQAEGAVPAHERSDVVTLAVGNDAQIDARKGLRARVSSEPCRESRSTSVQSHD